MRREVSPEGAPASNRARFRLPLALGLAVLAGMEAGTRLDDRVRFGTPLTAPWASRADLVGRDALGMHARAGARFRHFVINPQGTRGPSFSPDRSEATLRIVTAGASETFGLGESAGREFPRQLEDSLSAALGDGRWAPCAMTRVEVINPAVPGMTLPTVIQDLERRVSRWSPDLVVYYPTPSQYLADQLPTAARTDSMAPAGSPPPRFRLRFLPRLTEGVRDLVPADLADWLRRRERDRRLAARGAGWLFADLPAERLAAFEEDLRRLVGVARRIGARPILMSHAHRFGDDPATDDPWVAEWLRYAPRATRAILLAFDAAGGRATLRVAADSGIPGVDLPALIGGDTTAFVDFSHFTDQGAGRVASILGDAIRAAVFSCAPESDD